MRQFLKSLVNKPYAFGTYGLTIEKVADSKVSFVENINGTQFRHNYFKIEDAAKYLEYKTLHLLPALSKQRQTVDLTKATPEFRNQYKSHQDLVLSLRIFLYDLVVETEDNRCDINFDDENEIVLNYTQGQTIRIRIRQHDIMQFVFIDTNDISILDKASMVPHITYGNILERTCSEFEFKIAQTMYDSLSLFKMQKLQLKKFMSTVNENEEFPLADESIIDFVNSADNGQELQVPLNEVAGRQRFLHIIRQTRVKYMIEVRNFKEDGTMQEEYWTYITKFSADFTGNIEKIKKIYNNFV